MDTYLFLKGFPVGKNYVRRSYIHIIFSPSVRKMTENSETTAHVNYCKDLRGSEKVEFIESILEDYYFSLELGLPPPITKFHRELFSQLVKTFGH